MLRPRGKRDARSDPAHPRVPGDLHTRSCDAGIGELERHSRPVRRQRGGALHRHHDGKGDGAGRKRRALLQSRPRRDGSDDAVALRPVQRFHRDNWLIDTDGNGIANYVVVVRFCSHLIQGPCVGDEWHWESALTEPASGRRIAAFDFAIEDNVVKAFVATSQLGDPTAFRWIAATRTSPSSSNLPSVDIAPDLAAGAP